jgi:hypothetical protein
MGFSTVGKQQLAAHAGILLVNFVVLAFSARVNQFQEYFFVADLFPLALSITTFVVLIIVILLDLRFQNTFTARPPFLIGLLSVFTIIWLAFNAFSTSRWRYVPMSCDTIPSSFPDERKWCKDILVLRAFIWVEWVLFLLTLLFTLRFSASQASNGCRHIWTMSLSRYTPSAGMPDSGDGKYWRSSDFLQFEKMS